MRADMHLETVLEHLRNLRDQGENMSKKKIKQKYPRLMSLSWTDFIF